MSMELGGLEGPLDDAIATLARRAQREGANVGPWPGLTIYRFTRPTAWRWDGTAGLSVGMVVRERRVAAADGYRHVYDRVVPATVGALPRQDGPAAPSPDAARLCVVLSLDPRIVRKVQADMGRPGPGHLTAVDGDPGDDGLTGSLLRFLGSLSSESDRRVLAPLYLHEIAYRALQRHGGPHLNVAARQGLRPLTVALDHIAAHLADPLTVTALARLVNLSPSAFSRLFRESTGRSPYQFIKESRLDRARDLVVEGRLGVADVSRAVGYGSPSHFIKEFRNRFGATPGEYGANPFAIGVSPLQPIAV